MTREAKIGMLTGLGVIVLIGVLLSEYLGDPKGMLAGITPGSPTGAPAGATPGVTPASAAVATGHAAELPIGATYRQQMMSPLGVPGMGALAGGAETGAPFSTGNAVLPPAYAEAPSEPAPTSPTISPPVSPTTVEPLPAQSQIASGTPATFRLPDPTPAQPPALKTTPDKTASAPTAAPSTVTYVIASGDNLAKIAKKFYNSTKNSDVQRIIAANASQLKDATTPLIAGKKLTIPNAPIAASTPAAPHTAAVTKTPSPTPALRKTENIMIYLPGPLASDTFAKADASLTSNLTPPTPPTPPTAAQTTSTAKKLSSKTYVVQSGDTLEKIAKKIAPANPTEMIEKLKAANAIKDVHSLQINQTLKLPV